MRGILIATVAASIIFGGTMQARASACFPRSYVTAAQALWKRDADVREWAIKNDLTLSHIATQTCTLMKKSGHVAIDAFDKEYQKLFPPTEIEEAAKKRHFYRFVAALHSVLIHSKE